ncbi:MAG: hypothetical protein ABIT05_12430 [Chitinophagaceae bacterium]
MKLIVNYLSLVFISLFYLVSCSKKDVHSVTQNLMIYGRVVEAGTDQPLNGAEFITSTCGRTDNVFGCLRWDEVSSFTGVEGKFSASREQFRNRQLRKNGYWDYIDEPDVNALGGYVNSRPAPVTYYTNISSGQLDSILVKLFPVTTITMHVRNTGASTGATLQCKAYQYGTKGDNISLRPGIDSSFQYPVFGNAGNRIFIFRDYPFNDTVGIQVRYITKGEVLGLDISY